MPEINIIPDEACLYDGNQPYHVLYDNLPLKNILRRIDLINTQVDINTDILRGSGGNVGSLNYRLSVALHDNGKIISSSVDSSMHNIGKHLDGSHDGVDYVRMKKSERDKLELVQSEANKLYVMVEDSISNPELVNINATGNYTLETGVVKLKSSDTIFFDFEVPTTEQIGQNIAGTIKAHCLFPPVTAHRHYYGVSPVMENIYKEFKTTILNSKFIEGSLRVYVNGVRLNSESSISVPNFDNSDLYDLYVESEDANSGTFTLSNSITSSDNIFIDFDQRILSESSSEVSISGSSDATSNVTVY